jgi:alkyl sulfatase BDS1-like metallo-beta-lactamase superfamily hydrolase
LIGLWFAAPAVLAQSRDAEPATRAANDAFTKSLPFSDRADFDDVKRGFTLSRAALDAISLKRRSFADSVASGDVSISGNPLKLGELFGLLDKFPPGFEVVEPKKVSVE